MSVVRTKAIYKDMFLLDQHVFHLYLQLAGNLEIHLRDEKEASQVLEKLKEKLDPATSSDSMLQYGSCYKPDKKCHIIVLNKECVEAIWGEKNFAILKTVDEAYNLKQKQYLDIYNYFASFDFENPFFQLLCYLHDTDGFPFILFLCIQFPDLFAKLLNDLPQTIVNKIFSAEKNLNILHIENRLSSSIYMKLIDVFTDENLNQIITKQDEEGRTALMHAFRYQPPEICIKLIDRLSDDVLQEALLKKDKDKFDGLQVALTNQPPEVCIRLIDRIPAENLNDIIVQLYARIVTNTLHPQPESIFIAIVKKVDAESLALAACPIFPESSSSCAFELAAEDQSEEAYHLFLQKLNCQGAKKIINQYFRVDPENLVKSLKSIAFRQSFENFELFFSLLNAENQRELINRCKQDIHHIHMRLALRALQAKLSSRQSDVILLPKERLFGGSGYESKFTPPMQRPKIQVTATLQKKPYANLFELLKPFDEAKSSEEKKPTLPTPKQVEKDALAKFIAGCWVKIVRQHDEKDENKHNREFTAHLVNPTMRQDIRAPENKAKQGYKLQLNPNENKSDRKAEVVYTAPGGFPCILKADSVEQRAKWKLTKAPAQDTTKHPFTYVIPEVRTGLFGYHDEARRLMVGYAFTVNSDLKKIKLLCRSDASSRDRWWYQSDLHNLYNAAHYAKNYFCRTFAEFKERIKKQPYQYNEALVKVNQKDLFAIIIADDRPEARQLAIQRRLELIREHNIDLPTIFYHIEKQKNKCSAIYSGAEQYRDFPNLFLDELSQSIKTQITRMPTSSFFQSPEMILIHFDYQDYQVSHAVANKILAAIKVGRKNPEKCFNVISKLLEISGPVARFGLLQIA